MKLNTKDKAKPDGWLECNGKRLAVYFDNPPPVESNFNDEVCNMLKELRSSEHSMTRRGGLLAEAAEMIEKLSFERDALTKGLIGVADDKWAAQISKLRDGLIAAQESLTAIRRNNNILHYKTMTKEEARKGIIKVCEALEVHSTPQVSKVQAL